MSFTYRENQNTPMTWPQLDGNFREVEKVQVEVSNQALAASASAETANQASASASLSSGQAEDYASLAEEMARISVVRWCGNHEEAPSTRLDGSPLQISDEYGNLSDNLRYNWTSTSWVALNSSAQQLEERLGDPSAGSDLIQYQLRHLADAVPESVSGRLDQTVHFWSFLSPEQRADVASFAGTIDCTDAWDKMLASLRVPGTFVYPITPRIYFPFGAIYFASEKIVDQLIWIVGHQVGQSVQAKSTRIRFPKDCGGFTFIKGNTGPYRDGADGSILEGLYIEGGGKDAGAADRTKHGIDMQARITVNNSVVANFSGNGINIVADVAGRSNANLWVLDKVSIDNNGMHGLYVQGGDTNAGNATMINANNNNRSGIFDASFLGNTYTACHTSSNGRKSQVSYGGNRYYCKSDTLGGSVVPGTDSTVWGLTGPGGAHTLYPNWVSGGEYFIGYGYRSTGLNARNVFVGCYSEGAEPPALINGPGVVLGGIMTGGGAGFLPESTALVIAGGSRISDFSNPSHGPEYFFSCGDRGKKAAFGLFAAVDHVGGITHQWDAASGAWIWKWANIGDGEMSYMTTSGTTVKAGRSSPVGGGKQGFPKPIILGDRYFGRAYWTTGISDPTVGEFARGEVYLFSGAGAGGKIGLICTTSGIAGSTAVFKQFGAIDA